MDNPFKSSHDRNYYEKIKIVFFTLTGIAIIRFILFLFFLLISVGLSLLFLIGYESQNSSGNYINFSRFRRYLLLIPQILLRIGLFFLGYYWFNENIFGFFNFTYLEKYSKLYIVNHVSFIDTMYLFCRGIPTGVASYNTLSLPVVGSLIKRMGPILVPTNTKQRALLPNPKEQITYRLTHPSIDNFDRPLIIFPEGCTKNNKFIFKFQKGAFQDNIPYQPIILKYKYKYLDPSWTFDSGNFKLMYLMCCQFVNFLEVEYMCQSLLSAEEIRKIYIDKLQCVNSSFSNHDVHYLRNNLDKMDYIYKYVYNEDSKYNLEYYTKKTGLTNDQFSELVNLFYEFDTDKDGKITCEDLIKIRTILKRNFDILFYPLTSYNFTSTISTFGPLEIS